MFLSVSLKYKMEKGEAARPPALIGIQSPIAQLVRAPH